MITTGSLYKYPQDQIDRLFESGSISPLVDSSNILSIENTSASLFSSSITISVSTRMFSKTQVETRFSVDFSEL